MKLLHVCNSFPLLSLMGALLLITLSEGFAGDNSAQIMNNTKTSKSEEGTTTISTTSTSTTATPHVTDNGSESTSMATNSSQNDQNDTTVATTPSNETASTSTAITTEENINFTYTTVSETIATNVSSDNLNDTVKDAEDRETLIIIVAVAAVAGAVVGVVCTVVVVVICRRKKRNTRTSKKMSIKRNLSYTVNKEDSDPVKVEPEYIQIFPDPVSTTDDYCETKQNLSTTDKATLDAVCDTTLDDDSEKLEYKEDDYDVVADDEIPVNTTSHLPRDDYSHIKIDGRKISDTSYSHLNLDHHMHENHNNFKTIESKGIKRTDQSHVDNDCYSNLDRSIDVALQAMDKTIADFEYNNVGYSQDGSSASDNESDADSEERYNRLGSLKLKNGFGQNKLNLGHRQRHRSRSLPAQDLQPQVNTLCDEMDTYDHLNDASLHREPTYCNVPPARYGKSKSLPAQENLKYTEHLRRDDDAYSHIDLSEKTIGPRRKNAIATMHPPDVRISDKYLAAKSENNDSHRTESAIYDYSSINHINNQASNKPKPTAFTIQEEDSHDEEPHSYFILEPTTSL